MKSTQNLPENFMLAWNLDLKHNTSLNIILQVIGLGWMVLSGWGLSFCLRIIRPEYDAQLESGIRGNILTGLMAVITIMILAMLLHELVHGLFFWLFSHHKPEFGLGPGYAYAAMPDWFFPKKQYLMIGLAPLIFLTGLGLALSMIVPSGWLLGLLIGMVINAGGAIGDIYICGRIALDASDVWIKDTGDGFQLYRRQKDQ
ncbi:MAG: DUF3267 domain-containing protein [Chloroflexota bacterium]